LKQLKVLVIGVGRFGTSLVEELYARGAEVIAIDRNREAVDRVASRCAVPLIADGSDPKVLENAGAAHVDVAVITSGESFEASVMAVASLKRLGVKHIVARAANERQAEILDTIGATRSVVLESEMGHRVALELMNPESEESIDFANDFAVQAWSARGPVMGKTLAESGLRTKWEINVLGVRRPGSPKLMAPTPQHVISAGDTLLLVATHDALARFFRELE
jgi:trk system potassium uptake protein TrkA